MSQSLPAAGCVVGVVRKPPVAVGRYSLVVSRNPGHQGQRQRPATNDDLPYLRMRKNSSADLRGSRNRSDITATESAPASITEAAFARVIPPIATRGLRVSARARRTPSRPTTGSGLSLLEVENTGPIAR